MYVHTINKKIKKIHSWPTVTGKVLVSVLEEKVDGESVGTNLWYSPSISYHTTTYNKQFRPRVQYEYNTDLFTETYINNKVSYEEHWISDILEANQIMRKFEVRAPVKVYYNPDNHKESYIMLDDTRSMWNIHTTIFLILSSFLVSINMANTQRQIDYRYRYRL